MPRMQKRICAINYPHHITQRGGSRETFFEDQGNLYQEGDINRQAPRNWEVYKRLEKIIERDFYLRRQEGHNTKGK